MNYYGNFENVVKLKNKVKYLYKNLNNLYIFKNIYIINSNSLIIKI